MITVLIVILTLLFVPAGIGPLLVTDETSGIVAQREYPPDTSNPCSER